MDLNFGHTAPKYQDEEILNDEVNLVNFGPNYIQGPGLIHEGYAFHED